MVHDFPGDLCSETDKSPCLRVLISTYSSSLRSCGAFSVINAGIHMFMVALLYLSCKQILKKKKVKLQTQNIPTRTANSML
ncbi:hypothetical protein TVAGG3_0329560 [Trichomonas vaginalis G3]|uniref:hypothetical protein n=1 Tax=Trichomonas vaginalis (strain ATCC PRA-98 / G3) TaxID=412133 RepID=UPI0021E575B3|nr:hypothetical protein TVAGG3_0329470 [Trichomonas vaginalis G3]XP_051100109.1 hypothetical protein TVAGG3_0329560 [Trichomonas vaginalis G3]KAI5529852.1 hypothetical protein TVAGG3_0329470 [Trichomonas vaginalis G3]KAI5529856.1 hypothetical protein TVAGG3_0329560 [Trichomonas vaginalis G3]